MRGEGRGRRGDMGKGEKGRRESNLSMCTGYYHPVHFKLL